jgi:hypothetical protein
MTNRVRWVIGWAEDDNTAGAHCCTCWDLQLWVERMMVNSSEAFRYGCEGMMAIHWRTAAASPNIMALAHAGWDFNNPDGTGSSLNAIAGKMPEMDAYWADWGRGLFGGSAGAEVGRTIQKFDGSHPGINALVRDGARTTDEQISEFFAPLRELESSRPRIKGAGNLERFDYWLNLIRATHLRVRTWVLANRLEMKLKAPNAIQGADQKRAFAQQEILPLRLEIARSYENLIAAFVMCARSPGEIGTIASIESGSRGRVVSAHDSAIAELLGVPLPAQAAIDTAYHGAPRICLSAKTSQLNAREPLELRPFVLSGPKCTELNLYWRPLGKSVFKKVVASHRARQAYRVTLPALPPGTVEYYLQAALEDGRKVFWPATAPSMNQTVVVW